MGPMSHPGAFWRAVRLGSSWIRDNQRWHLHTDHVQDMTFRYRAVPRSQRRWIALAATTPSAIDVTTHGCMRLATSPMA